MKHSNLLLISSALLATTALSASSNAATIFLTGDTTAAATPLANPKYISAQALTAAQSADATTATGTNRIMIRWGQNTSAVFTATVNVTGAKFVTAGITSTSAVAAKFAGASVPSSVDNNTGTAICTVTPGVTSLILACDTTKLSGATVTSTSVNGLIITGVAFDTLSGLATAGSSISLDYTMKVGNETLDSAAATAVLTSRASLTGTSTSVTAALIDVSAAPAAFNKLVGPTSTATIGSLSFTIGAAGTTFARDLSTALTVATVVGSTEVKVTTPIVPATAIALLGANTSGITSAKLVGNAADITVTPTQFGAGFVTFAIPAASLTDNFAVNVVFNGTSEIAAAAAGTTTITPAVVASPTIATNNLAPPAFTGTVGGLSRNGFSIDFNGVQPGTAQGARTYTSLIRISNTGLVAGTVSIIVANETTGAVLGTYTSASIPAGASLQVSSAQIEAGAGITASAAVLYRLALSGSITGYAQHVNWNQDAGFFSDLSSRRTERVGSGL